MRCRGPPSPWSWRNARERRPARRSWIDRSARGGLERRARGGRREHPTTSTPLLAVGSEVSHRATQLNYETRLRLSQLLDMAKCRLQPACHRHPEGRGSGVLEECPSYLRLIAVLAHQPGHEAGQPRPGRSRAGRAPPEPEAWLRCRSRPGWSSRSAPISPALRRGGRGSPREGAPSACPRSRWRPATLRGRSPGRDMHRPRASASPLGTRPVSARARARADSNLSMASTRWAGLKTARHLLGGESGIKHQKSKKTVSSSP